MAEIKKKNMGDNPYMYSRLKRKKEKKEKENRQY